MSKIFKIVLVVGVIAVAVFGIYKIFGQPEGFKKFSNKSFSFIYPEIFSLSEEGGRVTVSHSIDYKHPDFCDFKGDSLGLDKFTDFGMVAEVESRNLKDLLQSDEGEDFWNTFFKDGEFVGNNSISDMITPFNAGELKGFEILHSVEGCGRLTYYFPISEEKTLVIHRTIISEYSSVNSERGKYLSLLGIITPEKEEQIFTDILTSFKPR
jgi:hypothetical protein